MLVPKTIVRNKQSGATGVVVPTIRLLREEGPLSVIYENSTVGIVIDNEDDFEVVGMDEACADFSGCGAGQKEKTCIFFAHGPKGPECMRFGETHWDLVVRSAGETMRAKRQPAKLYPNCKLLVVLNS